MFDSISFSASDWNWPALVLTLACVVLAIWSYWTSRGSLRFCWLATLLKTAAFALLALCLVEPVQRLQRPLPGANTLAVMIDNSRSMELKPAGESQSRSEQLRDQLAPEADWQLRLSQDFALKRYLFDERLQAVDALNVANFQGQYSMLGSAVETVQTRFANQPVAGLLLLSDGLTTDTVNLEDPRLNQFPIYPIVAAGSQAYQDIAIGETSVSLSSFELSPVTIDTIVNCHGLAGQKVIVRVFDDAGSSLSQTEFEIESSTHSEKVRLQVKPQKMGWQAMRIRATLSSEDNEQSEFDSRTEVTAANNSRIVSIDRGGGPYRVLYVAGRPNWEFKFLRRALDADPEIELHGLIRVAKKEPKFSFGDRSVGEVNPLVAGFSDNPDTAEQHDEPVLVRIGVDDESRLQAGFPSSAEDLFDYHAIVLDDIESQFFTSQQMLLMRQFVAERGGALMMLGGQESFLGGGYEATPLGDLLPVYLRGRERSEIKDLPAQYALSREGQLQPWLRLRPTKPEEDERFAQMPSFLTWNTAGEVKPGAATLATMTVGDETLPGLVAQRFGKGQAAALLIGDFWRWSLRRSDTDKDDLAQTWRQVARWLTSDVPKRAELEVTPAPSPAAPNRLTVQLRDAEYKPQDNASLTAIVTEPDGKQVEIALQPDSQVSGRYGCDYWSRQDGGYACKIEITSPDGAEIEGIQSGWTAQPSVAEFKRVVPDMDLLQQLAEKSGGEVIGLDQLDSFVSSLPTRKVPITETRVEPWWHRPWLVIAAIACLCCEWGLRRWKGLP